MAKFRHSANGALFITEWRDEGGTVTASMMYDLNKDPRETVNLVNKSEYQSDLIELQNLLVKRIANK